MSPLERHAEERAPAAPGCVACVPPLIAGTWLITKSTMYCIASVDIAR